MNMFLLEQWLENDCKDQGLDLFDRYKRIVVSSRMIWKQPRLLWFTDHSIDHSERIILILGQILDNLHTTQNRLSPHELYILLASCYLHDIGMQNMIINNKPYELFDYHDFEYIRTHHPVRAYDLIINRSIASTRGEFTVDIDPDPRYLFPIALICKGHGTRYFDESCTELSKLPYQPRMIPIRGSLLCALLMMADELDLNIERAKFPEDMQLSPIASLHNHINSYVANCMVKNGRTSKEKTIEISFLFPENSELYATAVSKWVSRKLFAQMQKTQMIIEENTNGELSWAFPIQILEETDTRHFQRKLPIESQEILLREVIEPEVVNYQTVREEILEQLGSESSIPILMQCEDEQVLIQMMKWINVQCTLRNRCIIDFLNASFSKYDVLDLLRDFISGTTNNNQMDGSSENDLEINVMSEEEQKSVDKEIHIRFSTSLRMFFDEMEKAECSNSLLVFQNIDFAEPETLNFIINEYIPGHNRLSNKIPVILSSRKDLQTKFSEVTAFRMIPLSKEISIDEIQGHLIRFFSFPSFEAREKAEEIFGTSKNGCSQGVLFAIERLLRKESRGINEY